MKDVKREALWFNYFYDHFYQSDDLVYLVMMDGQVEPRRAEGKDVLENPDSVDWQETCILNALCSGNTCTRITVCGNEQKNNSWHVDKTGTWKVYGSPFQLSPGNGHNLERPATLYPTIQYNLYDLKEGEVEIVLKPSSLLCIELFDGLDALVNPAPPRYSSFQPAANRFLFQGSITFEALAERWMERKPALSTATPVPITMNGASHRPQQHGQARIMVWAEHRRSLIGKLTHQCPSQLTVQIHNLSINIGDWRDHYISLLSDKW